MRATTAGRRRSRRAPPRARPTTSASSRTSSAPACVSASATCAVSPAAHGAVEGEIDLLYVDGAHRYAPARDDIDSWGARVPPGGRMLVHDAFSSVGVTLAILRLLVFSREFAYAGRSGSLAEYRRAAARAGRARCASSRSCHGSRATCSSRSRSCFAYAPANGRTERDHPEQHEERCEARDPADPPAQRLVAELDPMLGRQGAAHRGAGSSRARSAPPPRRAPPSSRGNRRRPARAGHGGRRRPRSPLARAPVRLCARCRAAPGRSGRSASRATGRSTIASRRASNSGLEHRVERGVLVFDQASGTHERRPREGALVRVDARVRAVVDGTQRPLVELVLGRRHDARSPQQAEDAQGALGDGSLEYAG